MAGSTAPVPRPVGVEAAPAERGQHGDTDDAHVACAGPGPPVMTSLTVTWIVWPMRAREGAQRLRAEGDLVGAAGARPASSVR